MSNDRLITTLLRTWIWLHLASLVAVLLQPSTPATVLGRYSRTSLLVFGGLVFTFPIVIFASRWLARNIERLVLQRWQYLALLFVCALAIFGCWLLNTGPTSSYLVIRLYVTFLILTAAIRCLQHLTFPAIGSRLPLILGVGVCLFLLAISARFPPLLWTDEGYMASGALGFLQTGHPLILMLRPMHLETHSLTHWALGVWYRLFGVDISTGRTFIFALSLLSLMFVHTTVRLWYSPTTAWFTTILAAFALIAVNYLRTDVGVLLALSIAFFLFVQAQKGNRPWLHLFVGIALVFGMDGHPNAYRFCIAFGFAYLLDYALLLRERRHFFVYWPVIYLIIGGLLGFGAYFVFWATISRNFVSYARSPLVAFNPGAFLDTLSTQFGVAIRTSPLLFGAAIVGFVVAVHRAKALDRLLITTIVVPGLIIALLYGYYRDYYLMHSITPFALLGAGAFWELERNRRATVSVGIVVLMLMACLGWLTQGLITNRDQGYFQALDVADKIRAVVPKDGVFVGIDPFYFRMYDYPSFVEMQTGSWVAKLSNIDQRAAWEQIGPTAIAIVQGYPVQPPPELLDYIVDHQLKRVYCWSTTHIGQVDLYMKDTKTISAGAENCEILGRK